MEADLEAANQEIEEATAAQDKTQAELAALEETMKIQQVRALDVSKSRADKGDVE